MPRSILCEALMVWLGMGVKVATLPVIALGVGIGVDYALYLLSVQLAQQRGRGDQPLHLVRRDLSGVHPQRVCGKLASQPCLAFVRASVRACAEQPGPAPDSPQ